MPKVHPTRICKTKVVCAPKLVCSAVVKTFLVIFRACGSPQRYCLHVARSDFLIGVGGEKCAVFFAFLLHTSRYSVYICEVLTVTPIISAFMIIFWQYCGQPVYASIICVFGRLFIFWASTALFALPLYSYTFRRPVLVLMHPLSACSSCPPVRLIRLYLLSA